MSSCQILTLFRPARRPIQRCVWPRSWPAAAAIFKPCHRSPSAFTPGLATPIRAALHCPGGGSALPGERCAECSGGGGVPRCYASSPAPTPALCAWWFVIGVTLHKVICRARDISSLKSMEPWFHAFAWTVPAVLTLIPLIAGKLGPVQVRASPGGSRDWLAEHLPPGARRSPHSADATACAGHCLVSGEGYLVLCMALCGTRVLWSSGSTTHARRGGCIRDLGEGVAGGVAPWLPAHALAMRSASICGWRCT